jgi:dTDP-4-amino-4,6-dideoxygalactose transaminase
VPAFTFFATAGCVSRVGATPVFVDVCPIDFNIDTTKAAAKITARTKAIIPVHLFGQSSDMRAVMALAKEHGLKVVEDAAQAIGAKYHGQCCGTFGDFGTYSFFPSKNLGGLGDGGLLTTENDELAEMARVMRVHGSKPKYYHHYIGGNFRLDALQAALLGVKLAHYTDYSDQRQANAAYYTKHLSQLPDVTSKLLLPVALPDHEHIWNQYTLRVLHGRRDALRQHLADRNIGCEIYYPLTLDQQTCFASTSAFSRSDCEVSHQLANEVISIPIYPELSESQKASVVAAIAEFLKQ